MSRTNARSRRLRHRPSRVVPAVIVAVILVLVAVLAAITAIGRLVAGSWSPYVTKPARAMGTLTWGSSAVIVAAAVIAVLGLILIIAGVKPGAFKTAQLQAPPGGSIDATEYVISDRAMARLAAARADTIDGVDKVSASASGRHVRVQVSTTSEQNADIRTQVRQGVADVLASAGIQPAPRVTATARTKEI